MTTRERDRERGRGPGQEGGAPPLEASVDAAAVAARARAEAAGDAPGAAVEVTVRTTASRENDLVRVMATPDTPVRELMDEACRSLGLEDPERYLLVASGEVLADGDRPLSDVVGEASSSAMRLVRRPEAGVRLRAA